MQFQWRKIVPILCGVALWIWVSLPVCGQSTGTEATPTSTTLAAQEERDAPVSIDKPGLENCYRMTKDYYRGAQPTAEGFRQLKKLGVKTVINLRHLHSDKDLVKGTGLDLVEVHMDAHDIDKDDLVEVFKVLGDPKRGPFFIHCAHGSDRTGLVTALYRIAYCDWPREKAYKEMTEGPFGFHSIWINIEHTLKTIDVEKIKMRADEARKKDEQKEPASEEATAGATVKP